MEEKLYCARSYVQVAVLLNNLHAVTWQGSTDLNPKLHLHCNKNVQPQYITVV